MSFTENLIAVDISLRIAGDFDVPLITAYTLFFGRPIDFENSGTVISVWTIMWPITFRIFM